MVIHATIGITDRVASNHLRDCHNAAGINDKAAGIDDNATGIGNNSTEIGDNASGIGNIAAKVIPC